jgi:hypothetical protein
MMMIRSAVLFSIVLAITATLLVPGAGLQAAALRITNCQTINQPGSYVLTNNLTVTTNQTCLVIAVDAVTIDLAGFSIRGTNQNEGGIIAAEPIVSGQITILHGITVRNGSISNLMSGINLNTADELSSRTCTFSNNLSDGIDADGIVRNNTVVGNGDNGIFALGIVAGNYASSNENGISGSGVLSGNSAIDNHNCGINAFASGLPSGSTVIGNNAGHNNFGLLVDCPLTLLTTLL